MWYIDLHEGNFGSVTLGNYTSSKIVGTKCISLKFENCYSFDFKEVRYISELSKNLNSISAVDDAFFCGKFENSMLKMTREFLVAFKGINQNGIFCDKS